MHRPALGQGPAAPPVSLSGDRVTGTLEALGEPGPIDLEVVLIGQPQPDQVLAGAGPAVVEQDCFAGVEHRRHQPRPVRTQFGGHQVDQFGVGGRRGGAGGCVETELVEHQPGCRGQHTVTAGEGFGEFGQRRGVDHRAGRTTRRRQCHRDPAAGGDGGHRAVDGLVHRGGVGQRPVGQTAERPAAHAAALPAAQRQLHGDVLGPARTQLPGLGDPLGDGGGPLAGRTERATQVIVDGVGQHRAVRLVGAGELGDLAAKRSEVGFGGTVDGPEVQFGAQVDEQLVTARRCAVGDGLDGVQRLDLVDAHLGRQRDQRDGGVGGVEGDVGDISCGPGASGRCRRGFSCHRLRRGGFDGVVEFGLVLGHIFVAGEEHLGVALDVEHLHCAVGEFGQLQGVAGQPGDRRRRLHPDLDEPLDSQAAGTLFGEQQILGLDPAHRAGELPGQ